jgi:hypothetical protein
LNLTTLAEVAGKAATVTGPAGSRAGADRLIVVPVRCAAISTLGRHSAFELKKFDRPPIVGLRPTRTRGGCGDLPPDHEVK